MDEKTHNRILIVSQKPPYPTIDGGCIAMANMAGLLQECADITYFSLTTHKHPYISTALPLSWVKGKIFYHRFIDTRVGPKHIWQFIKGKSLRVSRFYSAGAAHDILKIIHERKIQTVIFESIYAAVYLKTVQSIPGIKCYIRSHNMEYKIWESKKNKASGIKKWILGIENTRLKNWENHCYQSSDGNIFISEEDAADWKTINKPHTVIPLALENEDGEPSYQGGALKLYHIGAMDWEPNLQGILHFIEHIFPVIKNNTPNVSLHLAGKAMPEELQNLQMDGLVNEGEVKDASAFIKNKHVLVVNLQSGSGIRIKILEAMKKGKPVISTTKGMDGIPAKPGIDYLQANTPQEWAQAVHALTNIETYNRIAGHAKIFIASNYSRTSLLQKLRTFLYI